jgi:ferritin-like metal-binding protein YciE
VIADGPKVRSFQRHELTADFAFVRLHHGARGRRGNYSPGELSEWAGRIREWTSHGDVFVYFNNDWEGLAPANAAALRTLVDYRSAGRGTGARQTVNRRGAGMSEITTPRELFLHELGDILYVERALADEALPKLIGEVHDEEFRSGLEKHLEQTRKHVANVESVFESLGKEPETEPCLGFEGLKKEHDKMVEETAPGLIDLVDVGAAARTENYEIAAYESLRRMAKGLGEEKAVELLDANLKDEKETLREVEKIATRLSNEHAKQETAA